MEKIFKKVNDELSALGWTDDRSVFCDDCIKAVWWKKGELAEWRFIMDKEPEADDITCMLVLELSKQIGARMKVSPDIISCTDVEVLLESLKGSVVRLINKELGGGCVWQNV